MPWLKTTFASTLYERVKHSGWAGGGATTDAERWRETARAACGSGRRHDGRVARTSPGYCTACSTVFRYVIFALCNYNLHLRVYKV